MVLLASVLWGTTGTAQALAPASAQSHVVGTVRVIVGACALLLIAVVGMIRRKRRQGIQQPAEKTGLFQKSRFLAHWPVWTTLIATASMAAYQLSFFAAVRRTGVAVGTIVGIGSSPILAGLIGYLWLRERPGWRWGLATALAVVGCAFLTFAGAPIQRVGSDAGSSLQIDPLGVLLAVCAGGAYALFTVASKGLLEIHPPDLVLAVVFTLASLFLAPILLFNDLSWLGEWRGAAAAVHLGIVTVAMAYSFFGHGLPHIPAATAVTLTLAEPMTAGMLGIFLLGEQLSGAAWGGIGMVFAGLAILTLRRR